MIILQDGRNVDYLGWFSIFSGRLRLRLDYLTTFFNDFRMASTTTSTTRLPDYQTTFFKKISALRAADLLYKQYIIPCCSACTRVYDIRTLDNTWFVIFDFATATARDAEETRDSYMYMQEICK